MRGWDFHLCPYSFFFFCVCEVYYHIWFCVELISSFLFKVKMYFLFYFGFFETRSHYIVLAVLRLTEIYLPLFPKCQDYRSTLYSWLIFTFNYVSRCGICTWVQVLPEAGSVKVSWGWSYRWLWASQPRSWELDLSLLQEQYELFETSSFKAFFYPISICQKILLIPPSKYLESSHFSGPKHVVIFLFVSDCLLMCMCVYTNSGWGGYRLMISFLISFPS